MDHPLNFALAPCPQTSESAGPRVPLSQSLRVPVSPSLRVTKSPRLRVTVSPRHPISASPCPRVILLPILLLILAFPCYPPAAGATEVRDSIIITAEEIRAMKAHKMADLLNHLPGITAGDSSVGIHGSYKVKVFVDGRSINDPTSGHGGINWDMVSPDQVERIEILRGKGSLKYGQDASGGVILITTRKIRRLSCNVKLHGGNQGNGYGYANLQTTVDKWGVAVTGGFESTDGYKTNNDKQRWQTGTKLTYTLDEQKHLSFSADYLEDERGLSGLPDFPTPYSRKSSRNTNMSLQAVYNPLTSSTFFNEGRNHNTDRSKELDQVLRVTEMGQNLATAINTGNCGELDIGGGYILSKASGSNFDDQREEIFSGFAAQSLKRAGSPFLLNVGLRVNMNTAFDDAINPEIKLTYKKDQWSMTAAYSRSNNTPSFHQRYNRTSSTRPNPDLEMETADNFNLALFYEPIASFSTGISFFHNRLSDRITYETGDDGIGHYVNFGIVTYTGGDLAASWQVSDSFKINGSCTYLEAKDKETGLWLPAKAKHQTNLDCRWHPVEKLSIVMSGKYVSEVYRNKSNTKTVPGYTTADLRAEYAFRLFSLYCEIKNIFDKIYYYSDGLLAPPQTWYIGVNWRI